MSEPYINFAIAVSKFTKYVFKVNYGSSYHWEIERTNSEISKFQKEIALQFPDIAASIQDGHDSSHPERYLQRLYHHFGSNVWNEKLLVQFIDDKAYSSITSVILIQRMNLKIIALEKDNIEIKHRLSENNVFSKSMFDMLQQLQQKVQNLENVTTSVNVANHMIHNKSHDKLESNLESELKARTSTSSSEDALSVRTTNESDLMHPPQLIIPSDRDRLDSDEGVTPKSLASRDEIEDRNISRMFASSSLEENNELSLLASSLAAAPTSSATTTLPFQSLGSIWNIFPNGNGSSNSNNNNNNNSNDDFQVRDSILSADDMLDPIIISSAGSRTLPQHIIPATRYSSMYDESFDEILNIIQPHDPQHVFRNSAKSYLSKHIRKMLGSKVYEIGYSTTKYFLPDDPIKLSIILWKNFTGHWYTYLTDRLCRITEQPLEEDLVTDTSIDEVSTHLDHNICNVSYGNNSQPATSNPFDYHVYCMVDFLAVEVSCNNRLDLCLMGFYEEVALLVGKNSLFKRTLLLIRAWWSYETVTQIGSSIKHYISDQTLSFMLASIFNRFHEVISTPFQAFCHFISEYADIDWSVSILTLEGVFPITETCDVSTVIPTSSDQKFLISSTLLDKYWDIVNLSSNDLATTTTISTTTTSDGMNSADDNSNNIFNGRNDGINATTTYPGFDNSSQLNDEYPSILSDDIKSAVGLSAATPPISYPMMIGGTTTNTTTTIIDDHLQAQMLAEKIQQQRKSALQGFEKRSMNLLNPLSNTNFANDKCNIRRVKRIQKVFQTAAKALNDTIRGYNSNQSPLLIGSNISISGNLKAMFQHCLQRFSSGWRPDVVGNAIWIKPIHESVSSNTVNSGWSESTWFDPSGSSRRSSFKESTTPQLELDDNASDTSESTRDSMKASLDKIWDEILYSSLILEGKITESALLIVTKDILVERGTLPVGEIGKMLQELIPLNSLSSKLKEKFGGLKKFLERFSDVFVIGSDHPFNPHVYLKQLLTSDDLEAIACGSIPPQLLSKYKKAVMVKQKKKNNSFVIPNNGPNNMDYTIWNNMPAQPNPVREAAVKRMSTGQISLKHIAAEINNYNQSMNHVSPLLDIKNFQSNQRNMMPMSGNGLPPYEEINDSNSVRNIMSMMNNNPGGAQSANHRHSFPLRHRNMSTGDLSHEINQFNQLDPQTNNSPNGGGGGGIPSNVNHNNDWNILNSHRNSRNNIPPSHLGRSNLNNIFPEQPNYDMQGGYYNQNNQMNMFNSPPPQNQVNHHRQYPQQSYHF